MVDSKSVFGLRVVACGRVELKLISAKLISVIFNFLTDRTFRIYECNQICDAVHFRVDLENAVTRLFNP